MSSILCWKQDTEQDYLYDIDGGPKKGLFWFFLLSHSLLGAGVLGDGLGALRDGVLGQLSGQEEPDGGLDLPGGDGGPLVVVGELAGLGGDPLEEVVDEGVYKEDAHVAAHLGQHNNTIASKINICSPRGCSVNR